MPVGKLPSQQSKALESAYTSTSGFASFWVSRCSAATIPRTHKEYLFLFVAPLHEAPHAAAHPSFVQQASVVTWTHSASSTGSNENMGFYYRDEHMLFDTKLARG